MASQDCTIQQLLEMINSLKTKVDNLEVSSKKGSITKLWSGSHWMDGGSALTISNYNFSEFTSIVISCNTDNNDTDTGAFRNGCIYCPTAWYGARSYNWVDLTGDDWAGAWLKDDHTIIPQASASVWIRAVYGIK